MTTHCILCLRVCRVCYNLTKLLVDFGLHFDQQTDNNVKVPELSLVVVTAYVVAAVGVNIT